MTVSITVNTASTMRLRRMPAVLTQAMSECRFNSLVPAPTLMETGSLLLGTSVTASRLQAPIRPGPTGRPGTYVVTLTVTDPSRGQRQLHRRRPRSRVG